MEKLDAYAELEYQRRHLEGATGKDREMIMCGINRLLDSILDGAYDEFGPIATDLPPSPEGQAHINRAQE